MSTIELVTVIPNGMAAWYDSKTMPPRRERLIQSTIMPLRHLIVAVQDETYPLTREEADSLLSINELAVFVFLRSWTLKDLSTGEPIPLPASADAILDIEDRDLYDALVRHAAKLLAAVMQDGFSVDAVEDETSPTGDLGA